MPEPTSPIVNERARHLETLAATPAALKEALRGVPKKLLLFAPAPGKWSILEILCHLRDMEREAYLERYTRILAEPEPKLPDVNGDALAIERDYRGQKAADILAFDVQAFFQRIGLEQFISAQRRNGLQGMIQRIREMAAKA